MKSERFPVNSDAGRAAAANYVANEFAKNSGLDKHCALRVRLLAEETMGMVESMVDDFYGQLWLEGDAVECAIHLEATARMDRSKKRELLNVSTTGQNAARGGFMGRIGRIISSAMYGFSDMLDLYGREMAESGQLNVNGVLMPGMHDLTPIWVLSKYRTDLNSAQPTDESANIALDELEKSIVASIADEIVVGVKGSCIEMIIVKRFTD